jgi:hypothetical protein
VLAHTGYQLVEQAPVVLAAGTAASAAVVAALFLLPPLPALLVSLVALTEAAAGAMGAFQADAAGRILAGRGRGRASLGRALLRGLPLGGMQALLAAVVYAAWHFHRTHGGFPLLVFALLQTYLAAVAAAAQLYALPLAVADGLPARRALLVAVKLLAENRRYSAGALLQLAAGSVILAATLLGFPLVWPAACAAYSQNITENLLLGYGRTEGA